MKRLRIFLIVAVLVNVFACGLGDSPEKAAREWIDALLNMDGNKLAARTCAAQQENLQDTALWLSAFAVLGETLTGQEVEADISDLEFTTIERTGDTAQVRVTGEIRTAVLAMAETQEVDETWQMVREDGEWKWCGYAEMQEAAPAATSPPVVTILPQATPPSVETPQTQELGQETKTYTDDVAGFSIDYPTDWSAEGEAGYYAYIAAPSEDIYMNIAASQGVSLSDMLALHLDFLEAITTQISDPLEVTLAGKEGVVVDCEAVDMHGTRIHWREVLVVNGAYGLSFSCRSPADNWQTSQPLFESILGSLTFSEPMAMPEPTPEPELSLVGYDYEYRDVGDGWYEGSVGLALENQTDRLAGFNEIELPPPVIETQEGHTYQGQLGFYGIADFVETGSIGGARMIPPNFRIRARTREEPAAVIFRFAHAAHPTFITFPGYSRFRIDLSVAAQTNSLGFIGSDSGSVRSITELYGNVLVDEPGEAKVTVRTCIIRSSGNLVYPRLVLVIENRNQFEGVNVTVQLPQLAGIRPDGDVHGVEDPTHTYSVGPGQTEEHELELSPGEWDFKSGSFERIATSYVVFYDEIPDKYTIYALSDCTVMR